MKEELEKKIEQALPDGIELVEVQAGSDARIIRVFIDKEGGVDVESCSRVSSILNEMFRKEPPAKGNFTLEVSSPGLERVLRKPAHFKRFTGREIKVRLNEEMEGRKRFKAVLVSAGDEAFRVLLEDGKELDVPYTRVARANLIWEMGGDKG